MYALQNPGALLLLCRRFGSVDKSMARGAREVDSRNVQSSAWIRSVSCVLCFGDRSSCFLANSTIQAGPSLC